MIPKGRIHMKKSFIGAALALTLLVPVSVGSAGSASGNASFCTSITASAAEMQAQAAKPPAGYRHYRVIRDFKAYKAIDNRRDIRIVRQYRRGQSVYVDNRGYDRDGFYLAPYKNCLALLRG